MDNSKTASRQAARKRGLLINRDFTLLWSAQAISKLGDVVFDYTLVFWIATSIAREQRWAPLAVSGIFVATALPTLGAGPIAGVFVDRWQKRPTMLLMNALSFVVSFLALLAVHASPSGVRPQPEQQTHFLREFVSGLHFLAGNRVLMTILVTSVVGMFGFSAFSALGIFFALQNLHIPASLSSFLSLAFGVGAMMGAFLAGLFAQRIGVARTFWLSILLLSGLLLVYARQTSFAPAVVVSFLFGIPYAAIGVASDPLLLHVTPRTLIGRTFSAIFTVGSLFGLLAGMYAMVNLWGLHLAREEDGLNPEMTN